MLLGRIPANTSSSPKPQTRSWVALTAGAPGNRNHRPDGRNHYTYTAYWVVINAMTLETVSFRDCISVPVGTMVEITNDKSIPVLVATYSNSRINGQRLT